MATHRPDILTPRSQISTDRKWGRRNAITASTKADIEGVKFPGDYVFLGRPPSPPQTYTPQRSEMTGAPKYPPDSYGRAFTMGQLADLNRLAGRMMHRLSLYVADRAFYRPDDSRLYSRGRKLEETYRGRLNLVKSAIGGC